MSGVNYVSLAVISGYDILVTSNESLFRSPSVRLCRRPDFKIGGLMNTCGACDSELSPRSNGAEGMMAVKPTEPLQSGREVANRASPVMNWSEFVCFLLQNHSRDAPRQVPSSVMFCYCQPCSSTSCAEPADPPTRRAASCFEAQ